MRALSRRLLSILALAVPLAGHAAADDLPPNQAPNQVSGTIRAINGDELLITTRTGASIRVNAAAALRARQTTLLKIGGAVTVIGTRTQAGALDAIAIGRAKTAKLAWPPDQ